jgi:hypothetical protein
VRPTVFLEGFFLLFAAASVRDANELEELTDWRAATARSISPPR